MKAEKAASQYGSVVQMIPWQFVTSAVKNADAVILATSVERALFKGNIFKTQDDKPKILIDLGVPRNVSKIGLPSTIIYLDIDHITQIIEQNQLYKQRMLDQIAKKVPKVVEQFYIWQKQLHVAPVIRELRESSLNIEKEVYDSLLRKLPELDAHERKVISKHMKSIINQMIKGPIKTIKELSVQADADSDLVFFCKLFGLSIDETILESLLLREADHSQTTTEQEKIYET
jgi:glutamyl-tRNA reductase